MVGKGKGKGHRRCEICNIQEFRLTKEGNKLFFSKFPLNPDLCREWLRAVGNEELVYLPIEKLHQQRCVCANHFVKKDFNKKGNRLMKKAIPTLNLKASPLTDEQLAEFPLHVYRRSQSTESSPPRTEQNENFQEEIVQYATSPPCAEQNEYIQEVIVEYESSPCSERNEGNQEVRVQYVLSVRSSKMVQVRVSEGLLEGELVHNEYGGTYYSFKGIPYAQPPLGDLRFKAPQPPKKWKGVRSAKEFGPKCYHVDMFFERGKIQGSEDCLYLNIYTPNIKPNKPLPVMFWIHGGGFTSGAGDDDFYGPKFLVRQGVVVVTINYRLEVLGFLCLDTEDVPGNAGMKDQVQALRWVKKNIANFGGDPENVTIFGESAGGASVTYHLISPMSKGLFKRAISQSGVTFAPWAQTYQPRERAIALARKLGFNSEDSKELYEFLKIQPVESLVKARVPITFAEEVKIPIELFFSVTEEKKFGNNESFFRGDMVDLVANGVHEGVDVMVGYNADEGLMGIALFGDIENSFEQARDFPQFFLSKPFSHNLPVNKQLEFGKKIRQYYFKGPIAIPDDWTKLKNYYSGDLFTFHAMRWTKLCARSQRNKVYLYKFTCSTELNRIAKLMGIGDIVGDRAMAAHADDLMYLFNQKDHPIDANSSLFKTHIEKVTKLWTNFAKYGNPTPDDSLGAKWTPFSLQNKEYLDIGNELKSGNAPDDEEIQFWENLFIEFGEKLY